MKSEKSKIRVAKMIVESAEQCRGSAEAVLGSAEWESSNEIAGQVL